MRLCARKAEEAVEPLGTGVTGGCELPDVGSWRDRQVLLAEEPTLQSSRQGTDVHGSVSKDAGASCVTSTCYGRAAPHAASS